MNKDNIIIAFDFGIKNIGVAIGQYITYTAHPLISLKAKNGVPDWKNIKKIFNEWEPTLIIVGLPLKMDGKEQTVTFLAQKFAKNLLNRFNIKVILHDERLSTVEARSYLFKYGGYRALKKKNIDLKSAVIILESWLQKCLVI